MGVCVFTASGSKLDIDGFLRGSSLQPISVYHQGESPKAGDLFFRLHEEPGFMVLVGQEETPTVLEQVHKALDFLSEHQNEFERLEAAGVEKMLLSFAVSRQQVAKRTQYWPPELLGAMGYFHIGVAFVPEDAGKV
jgi:hypothetical protein